jgi:hypothetical protein
VGVRPQQGPVRPCEERPSAASAGYGLGGERAIAWREVLTEHVSKTLKLRPLRERAQKIHENLVDFHRNAYAGLWPFIGADFRNLLIQIRLQTLKTAYASLSSEFANESGSTSCEIRLPQMAKVQLTPNWRYFNATCRGLDSYVKFIVKELNIVDFITTITYNQIK